MAKCTKKGFQSRELADRMVQMKNYSETKKGRPANYFLHPCDACNHWHVLKARSARTI
jgi:hypothetical protein